MDAITRYGRIYRVYDKSITTSFQISYFGRSIKASHLFNLFTTENCGWIARSIISFQSFTIPIYVRILGMFRPMLLSLCGHLVPFEGRRLMRSFWKLINNHYNRWLALIVGDNDDTLRSVFIPLCHRCKSKNHSSWIHLIFQLSVIKTGARKLGWAPKMVRIHYLIISLRFVINQSSKLGFE